MSPEFLLGEKAPYLVTLFFAAMSWTVVRTVDRLQSIPLVEYRIETTAKVGAQYKNVNVRLRNVTDDKVMNCISVLIAAEKNTKFVGERFGTMKMMSAAFVQFDRPRVEPELATVNLLKFGPDADIELGLQATSPGEVKLLGSTCELPSTEKLAKSSAIAKSQADQPLAPIFVQRSLRTFIAENHLGILWAIVAAWCAAMLMIGIAIAQARRRQRMPSNASSKELSDDSG